MGLSLDVKLMSKKLGDNLIPVLMLRFEGGIHALAAVDTFEPPRLMLAEAEDPSEQVLGLTDGEHVFAEVPKVENWINDADKAGYFVLLVSVPIPNGEGDLARVLIVRFPFGHILANPGPMKVAGSDLTEALLGSANDGSTNHEDLIQKTTKLVDSMTMAEN